MKIDLEKIKAFIFDFDGVIGITMEDNFKAWEKAFNKYNLNIDDTTYYELEGNKALDVAKYFLKFNNSNLDPQQIVNLKEEFYRQDNKFSYYHGVYELLNKLKKNNIKLALVTGANRERLEFTREKYKTPIDVFSYFDIIVSATDIKNGKPHPEPYLKALEYLKIKSSEGLVIENAPLGIESAKAAGLFCVGITSTLKKEKLNKADIVFNSLDKFNSELEFFHHQ